MKSHKYANSLGDPSVMQQLFDLLGVTWPNHVQACRAKNMAYHLFGYFNEEYSQLDGPLPHQPQQFKTQFP